MACSCVTDSVTSFVGSVSHPRRFFFPIETVIYSTVHLQLHTHVVFSAWHHATSFVVRLKITHGMVNYHAWKRVLPCQEIPTRGSRSHCHAWLILKQCHVQSLMLRKHTILTVLKLMYTVLLTDNSCFTGITDAPYKLCLLWIAGSQQL